MTTIRLTIPRQFTEELSRLAVHHARIRAPKRTGAGAKALKPVAEDGVAGIRVEEGYEYMLVQNYGMEPRNMYELEGKVIPMRGRDGKVQFRTVKGVGRRKIVSRDAKGRIVSSKIAWRHPGLKPKNFLEQGIYVAANQWIASLDSQKIAELFSATELSGIMKTLSGEK